MCEASQMSEDILSEDIELTENVRQGGTVKESMRRKQKEEEESGAHVLVKLRYGRVPVIITLHNEEEFEPLFRNSLYLLHLVPSPCASIQPGGLNI